MIRSPAGFDGGDRIKRYLDYYQPSYGVMMLSAGQFSPALLFAAGEQGAWYDPSDFTTMFQDSAGTTPVTAVEQPVGLILDKSKGLALGAELVTNGDFATDTNWTKQASWTISGGFAIYSGVTNLQYIESVPNISFVSGKTYSVTYTMSNVTGGTLGAVGFFDKSVTTNLLGGYKTHAAGTYTELFIAPSNLTGLRIYANNSLGTGFSLDNLSIREYQTGNHASQSTLASRPVLSARVNQLVATATLSTQNVTTLAATYTLAFSGSGTVTASGTNVGVYSAGSNSLVCTAGTLTLIVAGSVTSADLRVTNDGVGLPAYQAVVTSTNYDTNGFPMYLRFDGTDDILATGTISPGAVDKAQVFAGLRKLSDAIMGGVFSASYGSAGGLAHFSPEFGPPSDGMTFQASGTSGTRAIELSPYVAPISYVLGGTVDLGAPLVQARVNAGSYFSTTLSLGGNFANGTLEIGNIGGYYFRGRMYSMILRFSAANLSDAQIASTETWVNGKTKAY